MIQCLEKKPAETKYPMFEYRHHVQSKECLFEIGIKISIYTHFLLQ
jgi:hypothetical protein